MPNLMCIPSDCERIYSAVSIPTTPYTIINNQWIVSATDVLFDHPRLVSHGHMPFLDDAFNEGEADRIHTYMTLILNAMDRLSDMNPAMSLAYELGMLNQQDAVNECIAWCSDQHGFACIDMSFAVDILFGEWKWGVK